MHSSAPAPPNNTSTLTVGANNSKERSFFSSDRAVSTIGQRSLRLDAQDPERLAQQVTTYLMNRYPQTVADWARPRRCVRCAQVFTRIQSVGQWQCKRHLSKNRTCCAILLSKGFRLTTTEYIHGCTPCDHEDHPQLDEDGEELRVAALPEHLLKMLSPPLYSQQCNPEQLRARGTPQDHLYLLRDALHYIPSQCQSIAENERIITVFTSDAPPF